MTYIRHVTLTTGHARDSYPGEVSGDVIAACQDIIAEMVGGDVAEPVPIPGVGPYSVSGRASGKCLVANVWADGPPSESICTIGVATHSRCGASLWRNLHKWGAAPVVTRPDRCPPEPWVAAALDAAAERHLNAMKWLGDLERCLAWAFFSSR